MPIDPLPAPTLDGTKFLEAMQDMMADVRKVTGIADALRPRDYDAKMDWFYPHEIGIPIFPKNFADQPVTDRIETTYQWTRSAAPLDETNIIESDLMTVPAEDWSRVRSPSRALRRMRQGHRQNVRYYQAPDPKLVYTDDTIIGHPETLKAVFKAMNAEVRDRWDREALNTLYGRK